MQHLTALSWAAFCIAPMDVTYKLQALDCDDLFDRLKLSAYVLRELRSEMEAKVALIGIDGNNSGASSPSSSSALGGPSNNKRKRRSDSQDDEDDSDDD